MRRVKITILFQVSMLLCMLFIGSIFINSVLAQTRSDAVSHAEHEQLKGLIESDTLMIDSKLAVLGQRLADDEGTIKRNTGLVDEMATTINRMEGIGISFGLVLTIVQVLLFRAHQETRKKEE